MSVDKFLWLIIFQMLDWLL